MIDPRTSVIEKRLHEIKRIIAVSSGKGGVGKSLVATTLALILSQKGFRVGLLDLDFTSPSTHIILGAEQIHPTEDKGIVPPVVKGLAYMSLVYYSSDQPAPLRGVDVSNALIELLSVTQWGKLDFLIIDMPPGIGDVVLDLLRLVKKISFLIVTTPSLLAFETVKKQVTLLQNLKIPILGVVENMKMKQTTDLQRKIENLGLKFLAEIPYDAEVEVSIRDENKLLKTAIGKKIEGIIGNIITEPND